MFSESNGILAQMFELTDKDYSTTKRHKVKEFTQNIDSNNWLAAEIKANIMSKTISKVILIINHDLSH